MDPEKFKRTMETYGLIDGSSHLIELSLKQGTSVPGKPLDNLTDRQLADAIRMVIRSDIMLETLCCAARDRIMLLSLQVEMRTRERDEAIHESSRRDQKWMDGIDEICGRKLSYKHDPSDSSAYTLQDFVNELRGERGESLRLIKDIVDGFSDDELLGEELWNRANAMIAKAGTQ